MRFRSVLALFLAGSLALQGGAVAGDCSHAGQGAAADHSMHDMSSMSDMAEMDHAQMDHGADGAPSPASLTCDCGCDCGTCAHACPATGVFLLDNPTFPEPGLSRSLAYSGERMKSHSIPPLRPPAIS